jgi:hypothetical protein
MPRIFEKLFLSSRSVAFAILLWLFLSGGQAAWADSLTVFFSDSTSTLSVIISPPSSRASHINCFNSPAVQDCSVQLAPNTAGATISTALPQQLWIKDPGTTNVSDRLFISNLGTSGSPILYFEFISADPPTLDCSQNSPNGCQLTEDGTVQFAIAVNWSDGTQDTVNFQSGPAPVPEPASMLLLGTGLVGLAGVVRRKLR